MSKLRPVDAPRVQSNHSSGTKLVLGALFAHLLLLATGFGTLQGQTNRTPERERKRNTLVYQLSPDGRHMAYLQHFQNRTNIFVRAAGSDSAVRVTSETSHDVSSFYWKGNDRIIYLRDSDGEESVQFFSVEIRGKQQDDCEEVYTERTGVWKAQFEMRMVRGGYVDLCRRWL